MSGKLVRGPSPFSPTKQADSSSFLCVYEPLVGCKTVKLVIGFGNVRLGGHPGVPLRKTSDYSIDEALKRMPFVPQLHAEQFRMDKYSVKKFRKIS